MAVAELRETIEWLACDLLSGDVITYLHGVRGDISRALGAYESSTLEIPTPLSGQLANRLVTGQVGPPNTVIVADVNSVPAWSGIVWATEESSAGGLTVATATPESFLDSVYTRDMKFTQTEQTSIMRDLAQRAVNNGLPLKFDITETGVVRDREYHDDEDATVYQRMQELSDVVGGPEWTIDTIWGDEHKRKIVFVLRVRPTIGAGLARPKGPISTHGPARATWKLSHEWGKGRGANAIIATASGEGDARPQSPELTDIRPGYPKIEYRWSPSSSIKEVSTLIEHASAKLDEISDGTRLLEIEARWDQPPVRLGVDLMLGDWIEYELYGPSRPTGMRGYKRMIGWKLGSSGRFTPYLLGNEEKTNEIISTLASEE